MLCRGLDEIILSYIQLLVRAELHVIYFYSFVDFFILLGFDISVPLGGYRQIHTQIQIIIIHFLTSPIPPMSNE
jgi:hypothetical protein